MSTPAISTPDPAFNPPTDGKSAVTRYPVPPRNETLPSLIERYPYAKTPSTRNSPTATFTFIRSIVDIPLDTDFGLSADELLNDRVRRELDRLGRADLDDPPLVEHGHRVGELEDLGDLVAHHDRGEPEPPVQLADQGVDRVDEDRIEPGGRLVEKDDGGLGDQGARDGHALAHAARHFGGVLVADVAEPHALET